MMGFNIKLTAKHILGRTYILYALGVVLVLMLTDTPVMFKMMKLRVLNRLMPPLEYMLTEDKAFPSPVKWESYSYYYKKVALYVPGMAEAYYMLGFSYYKLGREKEAIEAFNKAVTINPRFFWAYYNLGVIYYQKNLLDRSLEYIQEALLIKPQATLGTILTSKVFAQIMMVNHISNDSLVENLKDGINHAQSIQLSVYEKRGDFKEMFILANKLISTHQVADGQAYYYAGMASLQLNNIAGAVDYLKKCASINPHFTEAYELLAQISQKSGQSDTAQAMGQQAQLTDKLGLSPLNKPFECRIF